MTTLAQPQQLQAKSLDVPDEARPMGANGRIEFVTLGNITVGRATFPPGWRWSEQMKARAGTDLCMVRHIGYVISGRCGIRMADGTERELAAGDAFDVPPGHDAWVIGDEPYVSLDFSIELPAPRSSTGATEAPPLGHGVLLENDRVRVLEMVIKPGEATGMHSHPASIVYALSSAQVRFSFPNGESREVMTREGDITWSDGVTHTVENIGTTDDRGIIVELK